MVVNSIKDFSVGMILKDSWNGMANFFEVVSISAKSIQVVELKWETCAPDDPSDVDPTTRCVRLKTDENGNFVPKGKAMRKILKPTKEGHLHLSSIAWNGGYIGEMENPHDKMIFYWG